MLTALEDAQLEGQLQTKDQAILFIRRISPAGKWPIKTSGADMLCKQWNKIFIFNE